MKCSSHFHHPPCQAPFLIKFRQEADLGLDHLEEALHQNQIIRTDRDLETLRHPPSEFLSDHALTVLQRPQLEFLLDHDHMILRPVGQRLPTRAPAAQA